VEHVRPIRRAVHRAKNGTVGHKEIVQHHEKIFISLVVDLEEEMMSIVLLIASLGGFSLTAFSGSLHCQNLRILT